MVQRCNLCDQPVCCFHLMNLSRLTRLGAGGHTQKGTCNLHDEYEETEVDCLKLAGSIMKYWFYFMECVGSSELDV